MKSVVFFSLFLPFFIFGETTTNFFFWKQLGYVRISISMLFSRSKSKNISRIFEIHNIPPTRNTLPVIFKRVLGMVKLFILPEPGCSCSPPTIDHQQTTNRMGRRSRSAANLDSSEIGEVMGGGKRPKREQTAEPEAQTPTRDPLLEENLFLSGQLERLT